MKRCFWLGSNFARVALNSQLALVYGIELLRKDPAVKLELSAQRNLVESWNARKEALWELKPDQGTGPDCGSEGTPEARGEGSGAPGDREGQEGRRCKVGQCEEEEEWAGGCRPFLLAQSATRPRRSSASSTRSSFR